MGMDADFAEKTRVGQGQIQGLFGIGQIGSGKNHPRNAFGFQKFQQLLPVFIKVRILQVSMGVKNGETTHENSLVSDDQVQLMPERLLHSSSLCKKPHRQPHRPERRPLPFHP